MNSLDGLKIKIFADGADKESMLRMYSNPLIRGLTTNPTLMHKAGITDYKSFALDVLETIKDKPISFEVFSDDFQEMEDQAIEISSWAENVYVKIPITNTSKASSFELIRRLSYKKIKLNITAIMTIDQLKGIVKVLDENTPTYLSIFGGRIADTGINPVPIFSQALNLFSDFQKVELIWASPRELLNIFQADEIGCHIITVTTDIINKLDLIGYDLEQFSLDTVKMFYSDAKSAGFTLE